jgi:hypothetical protein
MFGWKTHPEHVIPQDELVALAAACYHRVERDVDTPSSSKTLLKQEAYAKLFRAKFEQVYGRHPEPREVTIASKEAIRLASIDHPHRYDHRRLRGEPAVR